MRIFDKTPKNKSPNFRKYFKLLWVVVLIFAQYNLYYVGYKSNVAPEIDLCIVRAVLAGNTNPLLWFAVGILIDALQGIHIGVTSFAFITLNALCAKVVYSVPGLNYTSVIIYVLYFTGIIGIRYLLVSCIYNVTIDSIALAWHLLATICAYPIIALLIGMVPSKKN